MPQESFCPGSWRGSPESLYKVRTETFAAPPWLRVMTYLVSNMPNSAPAITPIYLGMLEILLLKYQPNNPPAIKPAMSVLETGNSGFPIDCRTFNDCSELSSVGSKLMLIS